MIALHESLVEWTALALGIAVAAALLVRRRGTTRPYLRWPRCWLPGVALLVIVANAGIAVNAAAAPAAGDGAVAVRLGAIAASASLVVLLAAWLYLSRSLRVLPLSAQDDDGGDCWPDCPQCVSADLPPPAESQTRRRARGLTMTRLGGG